MIDYSIGEIESVVLKACRGSGMSWGLAEEGARAAGELSMLGLPTVEVFARLLTRTRDIEHGDFKPVVNANRIASDGLCLCPVYTGAWWMDSFTSMAALAQPVSFERVAEPLILVSFLFRSAVTSGRSIKGQCGDIEVTFADGTLSNALSLAETPIAETFTVDIGQQEKIDWGYTHQRAACDEESLAVLLDLAHETYVPSSEASRIAGAGAGLTDND